MDHIPNMIIAVIGDAIGSALSHSKLNSLFEESGFEGRPPGGNCVDEAKEWLRRANKHPSKAPFALLGEALHNFEYRSPPVEGQPSEERWQKIHAVLRQNGLSYSNGKVMTSAGTAIPPPVNENGDPIASRHSPARPVIRPEPAPPPPQPDPSPLPREVFVVHGSDPGLKNTVARFMEKLGIDPIILHELPDLGRTIMDKFEDAARAPLAVVLCTGDDPGLSARKRPRQNVILEMGFFIVKLGRKGVAVVVDEGVEMPSDFDGVLYTKRSEWQSMLIGWLGDNRVELKQQAITQAMAIR